MWIQDINKLPKFAKDELIASCGKTFDFDCVGVICVVGSAGYMTSDNINKYKVKHIFAKPGDFRIPYLKKCDVGSYKFVVYDADVVFDMKGHLLKNRYGIIHRILQ